MPSRGARRKTPRSAVHHDPVRPIEADRIGRWEENRQLGDPKRHRDPGMPYGAVGGSRSLTLAVAGERVGVGDREGEGMAETTFARGVTPMRRGT